MADNSSLGFEAGFGTGDAFGIPAATPQFTWQDLLKMFSNSRGVSPIGVNSQQLQPFMWPGIQQQNKGVPLYNPLQPMLPEDEQQKQSSVDDIAKYIKFFQGLF